MVGERGVEGRRGDRDLAERRAALGRIDDADDVEARSVLPVGVLTVSGEPSFSEWSSAYRSSDEGAVPAELRREPARSRSST